MSKRKAQAANQSKVNGILSRLSSLEGKRTLADTLQLADSGPVTTAATPAEAPAIVPTETATPKP